MVIVAKGGLINNLHVQLGSVNTNFNLVCKPFEPDYEDGRFEVSNDAIIRFEDSRELDLFIHMLNRFRCKNHEYFGDWYEED